MHLRRRHTALLALILALAAGAAAALWNLDAAFPLPAGKAGDHSQELLARDGAGLRITLSSDQKIRLPALVSDVDPRFLRMLTVYEDRRFAWHPGVDPLALARAVKQWAASGVVVSGASTLTMQVARLLEPRPRTFRAKLLEMLRALQLEAHLSKEEILQLYLTLAPYGSNLEGIRAASLAWLGKEPAHLTDAEAALLVVLPQAPTRLQPNRYPERARTARDKVLQRAAARGVLTYRQARRAMFDDVPRWRRPLPFHAAHLADHLFATRPGPTVRTTVDKDLQIRAEALAAAHAARAGPRVGAAVLVVDHRDAMAVRAWVGSPDYHSQPRLGAVDMVRAIRLPGSTLKPFVYGLAFDRALAHPNTRVFDAFQRLGNHVPDDFDGGYRGAVTAADALRLSLDIPAAALMDRLGTDRFTQALAAAGVPLTLPPGERSGPAVVLGAAGLALEHLVALYGALGSDGRVRPLRLDPEGHNPEAAVLLKPDTARTVAVILKNVTLPGHLPPNHLLTDAPEFAAMTGTSFGFRDAWALGVDGRYAVGVWIGRVDGTPRPDRLGRDDALPLLHDVFKLLPPDLARRLPEPVRPLSEPAPPALQAFHNRAEPADPPVVKLAVHFPPDGVTLKLSRWGRFRPVRLKATGGAGPVRWLVNGRLLDGTVWQPEASGVVTLTALDARGHRARATVQVK